MIEKSIMTIGRLPINVSHLPAGSDEFLPRDFRIQVLELIVNRIDLTDDLIEKGLFFLSSCSTSKFTEQKKKKKSTSCDRCCWLSEA